MRSVVTCRFDVGQSVLRCRFQDFLSTIAANVWWTCHHVDKLKKSHHVIDLEDIDVRLPEPYNKTKKQKQIKNTENYFF